MKTRTKTAPDNFLRKYFIYIYAAIGLILVGGIFIFREELQIVADVDQVGCIGPATPGVYGVCTQFNYPTDGSLPTTIITPPQCTTEGGRATRPVCLPSGHCSITNLVDCAGAGCAGAGVCVGSAPLNCCGNGVCDAAADGVCRIETYQSCPGDCVAAPPVPPVPDPAVPTVPQPPAPVVPQPPAPVVPQPPAPVVPQPPAPGVIITPYTISPTPTPDTSPTPVPTPKPTAPRPAPEITPIIIPAEYIFTPAESPLREFIVSGIKSGLSFILTIVVVVLISAVAIFRIITSKK